MNTKSDDNKFIDKFIFGEKGFWYVIIGDNYAGYFHKIEAARAFVKKSL